MNDDKEHDKSDFDRALENMERGRPGMPEQDRSNSSANQGVMPGSGSMGSGSEDRDRTGGGSGKSNR